MNAVNTPKLAIAMNYINDDLISGAIDYMPPKRESKFLWFRHAMVAACLCLMIFGASRLVIEFLPEADTNVPVQGGVLAEVVNILDDGRYEIKITGKDQNFANDDIVIINCDYINSEEVGTVILNKGDIIAVTYSEFEKEGSTYEITPGQIHVVQSSFD